MSTYYDKVQETAAWLRQRHGAAPDVAIVLGSGLGEFTKALADAVVCAYADVPHWPASAVVGHAGELVVGTIRGKRVAALERPRALLRRPRHADGDVRHPGAGRLRRADGHPHQRGGRHQPVVQAGHPDADGRPHQHARQQSAGRPQRGTFRAALPRHDRGLLEPPARHRRWTPPRRWGSGWRAGSTSRSTARATRRRPRSVSSVRSARMRSACRRFPRRSSRGTWASRCSGSRASPIRRRACCRQPLVHDEVMEVAKRVRAEFSALLEAIIERV